MKAYRIFVLLFLLGLGGCKFHAYGDSSGDTTGDTTTSDDGSVTNSDEVSAGGDIVVDDEGSVIEGGGVEVVSDEDEVTEPENLRTCEEEFLWKPESETGGLAVLFPEVCPDFIVACVFAAEDGEEECQGVFSKDLVTGQLKFQFSQAGGEYTGDLRVTDDEGVVFGFSVADPNVRNDIVFRPEEDEGMRSEE